MYIEKPYKCRDKLPTSTGDRRISEPSINRFYRHPDKLRAWNSQLRLEAEWPKGEGKTNRTTPSLPFHNHGSVKYWDVSNGIVTKFKIPIIFDWTMIIGEREGVAYGIWFLFSPQTFNLANKQLVLKTTLSKKRTQTWKHGILGR